MLDDNVSQLVGISDRYVEMYQCLTLHHPRMVSFRIYEDEGVIPKITNNLVGIRVLGIGRW